MTPLLRVEIANEHSVYLKEVTFEVSQTAGTDYKNYEVGTVAKRARDSGGLVPKLEYYTKEFQSKNREKYKLVMPGQFVYRKEGADIGNFGWNRCQYAFAVSPIYVVFDIDEEKILHDYLFNILRSNYFTQAVQDLMQGVARARLSYESFSQIQIPLPPLSEQKTIVELEEKIKQSISDISQLKGQIQDKIIQIYSN